MKAFVTGADGFIGSHLCEHLRDHDYDVTGLALYNSFDSFGWIDEVEGVRKVRGDVRDAEQMRRLIKGHDIVFHLAALISVPDSYERPRSYIETNVGGTLNVLEAAREAGAKVVHTSTSEVYGTAQYVPMDEEHPISPQSPYAASKVAADALVRSFHLTYGLPCVVLRSFNTFGPRQSERAVIPSIIRQVLDPGCREVKIGNGSAKRDFLYVKDTAEAFRSLAIWGKAGIYNAGSGKSVSINDLAWEIMRICRIEKPLVVDKSRLRPDTSEVSELNCDASLIGEFWRPTYTFKGGLERTIEWNRDRISKGYLT